MYQVKKKKQILYFVLQSYMQQNGRKSSIWIVLDNSKTENLFQEILTIVQKIVFMHYLIKGIIIS